MINAPKVLLVVKENLDNVDHLITVVSIIYFLITILKRQVQKQKIKANLLLSLENQLKSVEKSCDKLMDSYLLMLGSFAFFQSYEPPNSDEKTNMLVKNFYSNLGLTHLISTERSKS
jgi:hypothetical protein